VFPLLVVPLGKLDGVVGSDAFVEIECFVHFGIDFGDFCSDLVAEFHSMTDEVVEIEFFPAFPLEIM